MVDTYNDPIKQKSRERQRDFIARSLSFKRPQDIRVVCFPGAEVKGEEGLEIREVYDPLGIPRKNITGLELDVDKAQMLLDSNLGIQVVNAIDLDFFTSQRGKFDVISLDYTGYRDPNKWRALHQIAGNQALYQNGVLVTNYSAKREHKGIQAQMIALQTDSLESLSDNERERKLRELVQEFQERGIVDLKSIRDNLTYRTLMIMRMGTSALHEIEILKRYPGWEYIQSELKKIEDGRKMTEFDQFFISGLNETGIEKITMTHPLSRMYRESHMKGLETHITRGNPGITRGFAAFLVNYLVDTEMQAMFPLRIERLSYTSNKNTLMEMDLISFQSAERVFRGMLGKVMYDPITGKVDIDRKVMKKIIDIWRDSVDKKEIIVPEREYIGSSWTPPKRKERINRDEAVELLRTGFSPKEIAENYRGFTKMQLAALKAHHVTGMGKKISDS